MRRFNLFRNEDESGVSGTGIIAEGVEFYHGKCVLSWLTKHKSLGIYDNVKEMINIHGHDGKTELRWIDEDGNSNQ